MRPLPLLLSILTATTALGQYGSFDASAVNASKSRSLMVVLDGGNSAYDRALMEAIKGEWKFNGAFDFVNASDLPMQPLSQDMVYLMKVRRTDPVKFEGTFLTLVQGWKPKRGETLKYEDGAFLEIPIAQELAHLLVDPAVLTESTNAPLMKLYVLHLQDYLRQVGAGKITDKTTADRLYASRTRHIRDTELVMADTHLDKGLGGADAVRGIYTHPLSVGNMAAVNAAAESGGREKTISDVVITGDYKNKHCFKRIFNAGTGELMYLSDTPALHGKKEGFIEDDLKGVLRAR